MLIGKNISFGQVKLVVSGREKISPSQEVLREVDACHEFLRKFSGNKVIYGINTGFGPMAQYRIADADLEKLQYNIIRSHSTGAGDPLPEDCVRAALLARLCTFMQARSGVNSQVIDIICSFLNNGIVPFVPQHGSVGASGDLVQLAHIALNMIGEGQVFVGGRSVPAAQALAAFSIAPLKMYLREGLAVTNGTAVMTGIACVNLMDVERLLDLAVTMSVMVNEIASSYDDFMSAQLNGLKLHEGQRRIAALMRQRSSDSRSLKDRKAELYRSRDERYFEHKVQPYYSLRCIPQILGPVLDTFINAGKTVMNELNSVDDNPIADPVSETVWHGGNFHGDYISLEMDKLKMVVTKMTMLAERQMNYLFHDRINGILPAFVNMGVPGLNYGLQASQFTATSTTAESQTLSNPMYVHSIPNNNDNQDIVSMGTNSALLCRRVIENAYQVFAIEAMALVQAVDCLGRRPQLSTATGRFYDRVREMVPAFREDTPKYAEIEKLVRFMKSHQPEENLFVG